MPRSVLLQAGLDPDKDFKRVAFSGVHDATIAAVAAGKVQAGALNISVWEKFVAEKKVDTDKVRVFFTTPPYYDYNWSVSAEMPEALRVKLTQAFLALAVGQGGRRTKDEPLRNGRRLIGQALTSKVSFLAQLRTHSLGLFR